MNTKTDKEKAIAYDKAYEIAEGIHRFSSNLAEIKRMEEIFPALKESEDEKIRKHLIKHFRNKSKEDWNGVPVKSVLAWLEKQGEQKVEVKYVYTKFRIGDVIVEIKPNGYCQPVTVKYVGEGAYSCESDDGKRSLSFPIISQDEYKLVEQNPTIEMKTPEESLGVDSDTYNKIVDECIYGEQNPAWSEEDDRNLGKAIWYVENPTPMVVKDSMLVEWLKALKGRYTWQPSDEQMAALSDINVTGCISYAGQGQELINLFNDLKKLRKE